MSFTRLEIYFETITQIASSEHLVTNYNFHSCLYSLEVFDMWIIDKSSSVGASSILEWELSLYTNNLTQRTICKMRK